MKRPIMDVKTKRRLRLLELVEIEGGRGHGGIKRVAEKCDSDPNYLSQLLSEKVGANIGDKLAARIEAAYSRPSGWMDTYYSDDFVEVMLWVYEHSPEEGKRFIESTVEAVRIRYLKDNNPPSKQGN